MTRFARELRQWRLSQDITQAVAAEYLSVSLRTYNRYETGKGVPAYRDIQRVRAVIALVEGAGVGQEGLSRARV